MRLLLSKIASNVTEALEEKSFISQTCYFQIFDFQLTPDEIKLLESSGHNQRLFLQPQ